MNGARVTYHITFGMYGTRLHGDERGTVDRKHNQFGEPFLSPDEDRVQIETELLRFPARYFLNEQRAYAEIQVPEICKRGGWNYHMTACQPDHVHVLLSAEAEGKLVRKLFKRWLGEALSERWPLKADETWWAEGGSVKLVFDDEYFHTAWNYIAKQRYLLPPDEQSHFDPRQLH